MFIAGIRFRVSSDLDSKRSSIITNYLIHFIQMFAYMGIIIPALVGVDYFINLKTDNEIITNKYIQQVYDEIEFHIVTEKFHFKSDINFYESIEIGDNICFYLTPIFRNVTNVTFRNGAHLLTYKMFNIYSWFLIIIIVTFVTSIIVVAKIWNWIKKREKIKYDSVINIGIINCFLCLITFIGVFFQILFY